MLSWRDLLVIVRNSPRTSALAGAIHGEAATWGITDHLLAAAVDALLGANWQRTGKKGGKPKPVKRPIRDKAKRARRLGSGGLPVAQFDAWLARRRGKEGGS